VCPIEPHKRVDSSRNFLVLEVWLELRPYLCALLVDFIISAGLWILLFAFKLLTRLLAIDGWTGEFIIVVHSLNMILAFITFGILFTWDIWSIRKRLHVP
jgi:hypothetical protein